MRLNDMVALITGATHGIGRNMAQVFVAEGARVVISGRSEAEGRALVEELGPQARFVRCDLTDLAQIPGLVAEAIAAFGGLDILVNNAGANSVASVLTLDMDAFEQSLTLHVKAPALLTKLVGEAMVRQRRGGSIINITSTHQVVSGPGSTVYHVTKAALGALTRGSAIDLGPYGIRVNTLAPGTIRTGILAQPGAEAIVEKLRASSLLGRCGEPEELSAAAVFLASRDSSYMTAQELFIEGGRLALNPALQASPVEDWVTFRR